MTTKRHFLVFCFQPGATSHAVVLLAFHPSTYSRLQTNLNAQKKKQNEKNQHGTVCKKNTLFFIINEWELQSPRLDEVLCSSHSKPPSFPPSSLPPPVNQRSWLSPDGRQSTISHESKACLSLLLFMAPCLLKFFHLFLSVASLTPLPKLSQYSFPPVGSPV